MPLNPSFLWRYSFILLMISIVIIFVDWSDFFNALSLQTLKAVLLAQISVLGVITFTAWRHYGLLEKTASYKDCFKAVLLSYGLNIVLPARMSEGLKVSYLSKKEVSASLCFSAVIMERLIDFVIIGAIGLISLSFLASEIKAFILWIIFLLPIGALIVFSFLSRIFKESEPNTLFGKIKGFILETLHNLARLNRPSLLVFSFASGLLIWMCAFSYFLIMFSMLGSIPLAIHEIVIAFIVITLVISIPALPGAIGTYQAATVLVLSWFGYSVSEGFFLGVILNFSIYFILFPLSLLLISLEGTGLRVLAQKAAQGLKVNT